MNTANEAKALAACTYDIMNHGVKQTDKKIFKGVMNVDSEPLSHSIKVKYKVVKSEKPCSPLWFP